MPYQSLPTKPYARHLHRWRRNDVALASSQNLALVSVQLVWAWLPWREKEAQLFFQKQNQSKFLKNREAIFTISLLHKSKQHLPACKTISSNSNPFYYDFIVQGYSTASTVVLRQGCNSFLSLKNFYCFCYFVQSHVLFGTKFWLLKSP